ncbi:elongation factor P [bacterium]|nr:elongation factor P [bacterium]
MAAVNCTEVRKGMVVKVDETDFLVVDRQHITPGNWRGMVQMKLKNMKTGSIVQKRFGSTERLETVFLENKPCQYLYQEGKDFVFMDNVSYEQFTLPGELIEEDMKFVPPNGEVQVTLLDDKAIAIELPASVTLEIVDSEPSIRGDTATNVTKKAKCQTGLEIKVPQFIEVGEKVKVDTRTGEFISRSKE